MEMQVATHDIKLERIMKEVILIPEDRKKLRSQQSSIYNIKSNLNTLGQELLFTKTRLQ